MCVEDGYTKITMLTKNKTHVLQAVITFLLINKTACCLFTCCLVPAAGEHGGPPGHVREPRGGDAATHRRVCRTKPQ